ncbi:nitronate monooxygenase [Candidatus Parcubacteria bacterium]|nr:nitronate monooxygenase [Candidatus Parcubacteria bacterium]
MFEKNRVCQLLGIKYPIIQGGMAGISEANLVSAVSNAGGLGIIGCGLMPASWLEKQIKETREKTKNPFGVNLFMRHPKIEDLVRVVIREKIPVVFTGGGNPLPILPYLQAAKIKVIPVVPSPRLAKKMEDNGADAVVVEGLESGGHIGQNTTFCLIPQARKLVKIPLIAAGGIFDGKTAKAAFLLGAEGVQMGTRFLASKECIVHENYKKKILEATADDIIVVLRFTGHPIRVIKNKWAQDMLKLEERGAFPEEIKAEMIAGFNPKNPDVENIPLMAGICASSISEILSCKEIIEEVAKELETF